LKRLNSVNPRVLGLGEQLGANAKRVGVMQWVIAVIAELCTTHARTNKDCLHGRLGRERALHSVVVKVSMSKHQTTFHFMPLLILTNTALPADAQHGCETAPRPLDAVPWKRSATTMIDSEAPDSIVPVQRRAQRFYSARGARNLIRC
jgi:hypothetical protein